MQAMEFVDAHGAACAPAAKKLVQHCPHQGVLVLTGTYDNIIRLLMPLTITDEEY
jgi:4-aminobutyrate aminotransferase/(S)-3-amino-2-methylpropionate transaminase